MNKTIVILVAILNYIILATAGFILIPKDITFYHWLTFGWYFISSMICSFIVMSAIGEEDRIKREEELYGFGVSFGGEFDRGKA